MMQSVVFPFTKLCGHVACLLPQCVVPSASYSAPSVPSFSLLRLPSLPALSPLLSDLSGLHLRAAGLRRLAGGALPAVHGRDAGPAQRGRLRRGRAARWERPPHACAPLAPSPFVSLALLFLLLLFFRALCLQSGRTVLLPCSHAECFFFCSTFQHTQSRVGDPPLCLSSCSSPSFVTVCLVCPSLCCLVVWLLYSSTALRCSLATSFPLLRDHRSRRTRQRGVFLAHGAREVVAQHRFVRDRGRDHR